MYLEVSILLDELTRDLPMNGECRYSRVAWIWIAPNKLHQQSYLSMRNFFSERRSLRPVMFDEWDHLEEQRFYENDILNFGYVYTDLSTDMITIATDEMSYISTLYANRRKDLNNITLRSSYTDKHGAVRNRLCSQFRSIFYKTMEREWEQNPLILFSADDFFEDDEEY